MIAIVGGGISGLFLLHLLREVGLDAVLVEAAEIPGGVMASREVAGPRGPVAVDLGPQRMRLTPDLLKILDRLELTSELLYAEPGIPFSIYRRGRLSPAPFGIGQALSTPLISWRGKIRALADLVTPSPAPNETVAKALTRKLGPEIYTRLAGPLLGGLYGSDPAQMEARHTLLPALSRTSGKRSLLLGLLRAAKFNRAPVVSLKEGLGSLPEALARRHADRIRLNAPALQIERGQPSGFRITTAQETVEAQTVVLTLPAPDASRVLSALLPEVAERLAALRYNPLVVVPMSIPEGITAPKIGSGYKKTLDEPGLARGVTSHHTLFSRSGLYTAFLGGQGYEEVLERTDAELRAIACEDFRSVTGVDSVPLLVHRTWMPAWDRSWTRMDGLDLPAGIHICAAFGNRPGITGRLEDATRVMRLLVG